MSTLLNQNKFFIEDVFNNYSSYLMYKKWGEQIIYYYNPQVTFSEVPNEISLTIPTLCYNHCSFDCNSQFCWIENWKEEKEILNLKSLNHLIEIQGYRGIGITCIIIMTSTNFKELNILFNYIKEQYPNLKTALYVGVEWIQLLSNVDFRQFKFSNLDYLKVGGYKKECGGLNIKITNQKFYKIIHQDVGTIFERNIFEDCTYLFQKQELGA